MKKFVFSIMLLFVANIGFIQADEPVILHPTAPGNNNNKGKKPKMPAAPIHADQDGFTITFGEGCVACPITLFDEDENIVFTAIVDENGIVTLPTNLSGTFVLQLERGSIIFVGEIEL